MLRTRDDLDVEVLVLDPELVNDRFAHLVGGFAKALDLTDCSCLRRFEHPSVGATFCGDHHDTAVHRHHTPPLGRILMPWAARLYQGRLAALRSRVTRPGAMLVRARGELPEAVHLGHVDPEHRAAGGCAGAGDPVGVRADSGQQWG